MLESLKKQLFLAATIRNNPVEDAIRFGKIDLLGKQGEIVKFIKETIEPRLINLSVIPSVDQSTILYAQLEGMSHKVPVSHMGEGMSRLISIILTISTTTNGYVFIDEIENGIHYSALPKIWLGIINAAKQYNCQIFATTHSYECLESVVSTLDENLHEEFRYIRLERRNEDLFSTTYSFEEVSTSISNKWEIR